MLPIYFPGIDPAVLPARLRITEQAMIPTGEKLNATYIGRGIKPTATPKEKLPISVKVVFLHSFSLPEEQLL